MQEENQYKDLHNQGFSLVEIVVIIAIMIVLLAILTPSLLKYVENSRMQKDDSAMDEVCHGILLALSDSEIFDEAVSYSIPNNYITYTDSSGVYAAKYVDEEFWAPDGAGEAVTITFNPDENGDYIIANGLVNDMTYGNGSVADSRTADDVKQCYFSEMGDGKLYHKVEQTFGSTFSGKSATYNNSSYTVFITFEVVNGIKRADVYGEWNGTNLSPDCPASLGSGTSSYTEEEEPEQTKAGGTTQSIFTSSDLTGSGGTSNNIPSYKETMPCGHAKGAAGNHQQLPCEHFACEECTCEPAECGIEGHYKGDSRGEHGRPVTTCSNSHSFTCECDGWVVPAGGKYIINYGGGNEKQYSAGEKLPCGHNPQLDDVFNYNEYQYRFNKYEDSGWGWETDNTQNGWGVQCIDRNIVTPGPIFSEINGKPVNNLTSVFYNCRSMTSIPEIPSGVKKMNWAFYSCKALTTTPDLKNCTKLQSLGSAFQHCSGLTDVSDFYIPPSVTNLNSVFYYCTNLTAAPIFTHLINLETMSTGFANCEKLVSAPDLSNCTKLTNLYGCFQSCSVLSSTPAIPTSVTSTNSLFYRCSNLRGNILLPCTASHGSWYSVSARTVYYHGTGCDGSCGKV